MNIFRTSLASQICKTASSFIESPPTNSLHHLKHIYIYRQGCRSESGKIIGFSSGTSTNTNRQTPSGYYLLVLDNGVNGIRFQLASGIGCSGNLRIFKDAFLISPLAAAAFPASAQNILISDALNPNGKHHVQ